MDKAQTEAQEDLIGLALKDLAAAQTVAALPISTFDPMYELLITAIARQADIGELLTREAYRYALEQREMKPSETAGALGAMNRCTMRGVPVKVENLSTCVARVRDAGQKRMAVDAMVRLAADLKAGDVPAAARKAIAGLERVCDTEATAPADADPFTQKVEVAIHRDRLPKPITTIMDFLAQETHQRAGVKHLFCAAALIAAQAGKRIKFHNWGVTYCTNFACVILEPSGENKTGLHNTTNRVGDDLVPIYAPATSTMESFVAGFCEHLPADKKRTNDETRRLKRDIYRKHDQNPAGQMVLVDEFRAFLLTMVPKEQQTRNAQILCRILDGQPVEMDTITSGTRVMGNSALTFLGFSQADPWNTEVRNVTQQAGGLAGRIIPVNPSQFDLTGYSPEPSTKGECRDWLSAVSATLDGSPRADTDAPWSDAASYPPPDDGNTTWAHFGEGDKLGDAKRWFREQAAVAKAVKNNELEFALLEPKILVQAAKLAVLLRLAEATEHGEAAGPMDASGWLRIAFKLVGTAHLSNLYHEVKLTEQGARMEKVKSVIRRKKGATARDIVRTTDYKPADVNTIIALLASSGEIIKRPAGRTEKYYLT